MLGIEVSEEVEQLLPPDVLLYALAFAPPLNPPIGSPRSLLLLLLAMVAHFSLLAAFTLEKEPLAPPYPYDLTHSIGLSQIRV
jgi:hypothetical protein